MQKKMIFSFAIPIILIYIMLNTWCYNVIVVKYEEQVRHSMEQSSQQAVSFLNSHVQNMQYLANMIENNSSIQTILCAEVFESELPMDEQYREFFNLRNSFLSYELTNSAYQMGLYVDDNKSYSSNNQYIFAKSIVESRSDYEVMDEYLKKNKVYLTLSGDSEGSYVMLFKRIFAQDITGRPLNICSVSIEKEKVIRLIQNADVTSEGIVYLIDQNDTIVMYSNEKTMEPLLGDDNLPRGGKEKNWEKVSIGGKDFFMIRRDIENVDWQMISLIPRKEYQQQQIFIRFFQQLMVIGIVVSVTVTSYLLAKYYVGRLSNLNQKMNVIQQGNLNVHLPARLDREGDELDEIFRNFNFMVEELHRLMQEHFRLGKEARISELKALQSQINPHFLYNTLDLINWMAMDYGASDIENLVWNLSRFYRLSLNKGKNVLTVKEEVEHVRVYVNIENIHFDQKIHFEADVPEEIQDKACLNIILQPLVENSIVHGINEVSEIESMNISISAEVEGEDIVFHVQDDGPGMSEEQVRCLETEYMNVSGKGYGVRNINFRIKLCFGEKYGITYDSISGQGTTAHIRIPLLEMAEAEKTVGN